MDLSSWTQARGPELVEQSLWTRARGPELVDPRLGALNSILKRGAEIGSPSLWTQARGPELVEPGLAARLFSFSPKLFRVFLPRCNIYIYIYTYIYKLYRYITYLALKTMIVQNW